MKGLPWFRLYSEMPRDERIEEIAFEDRWHYVNILCMKCAGLLDKEFQTERMRERKISRELGLDSETAGFVKERLSEVGLIDDHWNPNGWDKRQLISDHDPSNAARQKRYREKNKAKKQGVTLRNVTVTSPDTDTDTDTDTEKEGEVEKNTTPRKKISEGDVSTAQFIFQKILDINPGNKKPNIDKWANTVRLMRERDHRSDEQIRSMFTWANNDEFWKTNILSPEKLRKQWDTLAIRKNNPDAKKQSFADQATESRRANGQAWLDSGTAINSTCERVQ